MRSVCIVLEGSCTVINRADKFHITDLRSGDHFGCSDLLKIIDIEFLGDIFAGEHGARIMMIPKPDLLIQIFEREALANKLRDNLDTTKFMLENRY